LWLRLTCQYQTLEDLNDWKHPSTPQVTLDELWTLLIWDTSSYRFSKTAGQFPVDLQRQIHTLAIFGYCVMARAISTMSQWNCFSNGARCVIEMDDVQDLQDFNCEELSEYFIDCGLLNSTEADEIRSKFHYHNIIR
jgi:hypothetical protein